MTKKDLKQSDQEPTTNLNIYQKLQLIQAQIKELVRSEENKFQKYKYFDELQVLRLLKPLLNNYQLTLLLSDDASKEFTCEPSGNMWLVKYGKQCELINSLNPDERLTYFFWASALNQDPAKAKGSAETYATKYFLSKLFLIPVKDEEDPDTFEQASVNKPTPTPVKPTPKSTITSPQSQELDDLLKNKVGKNKQAQLDFLTKFDVIMTNYGIVGATNSSNFKGRLTTLTLPDYQSLMNYLEKLPDKE